MHRMHNGRHLPGLPRVGAAKTPARQTCALPGAAVVPLLGGRGRRERDLIQPLSHGPSDLRSLSPEILRGVAVAQADESPPDEQEQVAHVARSDEVE